MSYSAFLKTKRPIVKECGLDVQDVAEFLYPFQAALVRWALRKGRAALFADCGLGKTPMQLEWARHIPGRVLILAPLCVGRQTITEAAKFSVPLDMIDVVNYERLHQLDTSRYQGIVLDESSILKAYDGKTRNRIIETFRDTPYKLSCTATPAPNDVEEFSNQAEFLGLLTRREMLATFFVHDDEGWRLKGHAREPFFRWMSSWAMFVRQPSDLGFENNGFLLPPLRIEDGIVEGVPFAGGALFPGMGLKGVGGRLRARQASVERRILDALAFAETTPAILWCGLNVEQGRLEEAIGGRAFSVRGQDAADAKEAALFGFVKGERTILITKPKIAGFGMNFQHCARMAFVGMNDSWETFYQAIRRCWRFGQASEVVVRAIVSEHEVTILENVKRKQREADAVAQEVMEAVRDMEREELDGKATVAPHTPLRHHGNGWALWQGDCIEVLGQQPEESVDFSVYSPPFAALFTYSASERDLGNVRSREEFYAHFQFFSEQLFRVTKPGRVTACHISQVTMTKAHDGVIGLIDLRGAMIDLFCRGGFVYHGEVCIDKNPQAQAIRTHSKALLFVQLKKDASWLRPALADYILIFRKPGEPAEPIHPDISNEDWIEWARPVWSGIRETDTLNVTEARSDKDERHICPLQLPVIERCIRLWSNKGDLVLSPFAGIGSEGYQAIKLGRRFLGIELKCEYVQVALLNLARAKNEVEQPTLFETES